MIRREKKSIGFQLNLRFQFTVQGQCKRIFDFFRGVKPIWLREAAISRASGCDPIWVIRTSLHVVLGRPGVRGAISDLQSHDEVAELEDSPEIETLVSSVTYTSISRESLNTIKIPVVAKFPPV